MKTLPGVFGLLAVLLSDVMCAVVAYQYRGLLCGMEHAGCSAPASTAFLLAVPYGIGIAVCAVLAVVCKKRGGSK